MKTQLSPVVGMLIVFVVASGMTHGLLALLRAYGAAVPVLIPLVYACGGSATVGCIVLYKKYKRTHNTNFWLGSIICGVGAISCVVFPLAV